MLNKILWGIATILIISSGIFFSFYLKGIQFNLSIASKNKKLNRNEISSFQTLMMSIAAKVGVGSLAGIALAIKKGGPGVIFWIWISSFISAPNAFVESYLGTKFRNKEETNSIGGPSYYIEKGLKNTKLAIAYAVIVTITYTVCFGGIQANTIVTSIYQKTHIKPIYIGLILTIIVAIIINKNTKKIFKIISKLVPFMSICYLVLGSLIIIKNYAFIPNFFEIIIKDAFSKDTISTGVLTSLIIGMQRGIFSNEAGIGTGAIASAASNQAEPIDQGKMQVLGTYFISLIIVTITAFIIMSSPYKSISIKNMNGIELTALSLKYHFGETGEILLIMLVFFFAISTIIAGYYYGKTSISFITKQRNDTNIKYKLLIMMVILVGSTINSSFIWHFSDIFIAVLAIINIYSMIKLRKYIDI